MSRAPLLLLFPTQILSQDALASLALSLTWSVAVASVALRVGDDSGGLLSAVCIVAERILVGTASVLGLLLAFRSNSATTRWNSGAKAIATMQATLRSLLRILGSSLLPVLDPAAEQHVEEFLALIPCFSLALLHQLEGRRVSLRPSERGENAEEYPALDDPQLLSALLPRRFQETLTHRRGSPTVFPRRDDVRFARKPEHVREYNLSQNTDKRADLSARVQPLLDKHGRMYPSNLALDILRAMQTGLNELHRGVNGDEWGLETTSFKDSSDAEEEPSSAQQISLSGPLFAHSIGLLNTLSMQLTELERLRDITIPAILSSHLHMLLNLQLILTPLALLRQLSNHVALLPIPCVVLTAATFGLHSSAERLAQPFGSSPEKLPVRRWCADILREWRECVGRSEGE